MSGGKPAKPIVVEAVEETPSTLPHTFLPKEGVDYLSSVTVGKDPNLVPENVKKDVSIFGTVGTLESGGGDVDNSLLITGHANGGTTFLDFNETPELVEYTEVTQVCILSSQQVFVIREDELIGALAGRDSLPSMTLTPTHKLTVPTELHGCRGSGGSWVANITTLISNGESFEGYIIPGVPNAYITDYGAVMAEDIINHVTGVRNDDGTFDITLDHPIDYVTNVTDPTSQKVLNNVRLYCKYIRRL